jgi:hypothetical protein
MNKCSLLTHGKRKSAKYTKCFDIRIGITVGSSTTPDVVMEDTSVSFVSATFTRCPNFDPTTGVSFDTTVVGWMWRRLELSPS